MTQQNNKLLANYRVSLTFGTLDLMLCGINFTKRRVFRSIFINNEVPVGKYAEVEPTDLGLYIL